ncbi:MAG: DedA family protein [Chloroflexi bacterium]|nr:DedA family protein [Chloroflexota bacterium]
MLGQLTDWVIQVVDSLGYVGVALLVTLENVFPPIPSELILALAGFVASRGDATLIGMIVAATVGSLLGAWILYGAAYVFGPEPLKALVRRYERWIRITEGDLDTAERWFARWSTLAVLLCRCVPLVRSLISIPAGLSKMNFISFTVYTTIGSLVWNTIFVTAGYLLGERWELVLEYSEYFELFVLASFAALVAYGVFWLARRRLT